MTWELFVALIAFIGTAIGIVTPIIKLNASITRLTCNIEELTKALMWTDTRLDNMAKTVDDHEKRITEIEIRGEYNE